MIIKIFNLVNIYSFNHLRHPMEESKSQPTTVPNPKKRRRDGADPLISDIAPRRFYGETGQCLQFLERQ